MSRQFSFTANVVCFLYISAFSVDVNTRCFFYRFRLKHCLQADQARVTDPNYKIPFQSLEDALSRLLPYHIQNEEIPPEIEWHKGE